MDRKIGKIVELCGYEKDHYRKELEQIFSDITIETYSQILTNKDKLILENIAAINTKKGTNAIPVTNTDEFSKQINLNENTGIITINDAILITGPIIIPGYTQIHVSGSFEDNAQNFAVYLGKGVQLKDAKIYGTTWVEPNALIEHSTIQPGNGHSFIGLNTIISNIYEFKGSFVSGGPLNREGKPGIFGHARYLCNVIVGEGTKLTKDVTMYNHPLGDNCSIVIDPETGRAYEFPNTEDNRKLAVCIGRKTKFGAGVRIHSGSIIGEESKIPSGTDIDGMTYRSNNGKTKYICARPENQVQKTLQQLGYARTLRESN